MVSVTVTSLWSQKQVQPPVPQEASPQCGITQKAGEGSGCLLADGGALGYRREQLFLRSSGLRSFHQPLPAGPWAVAVTLAAPSPEVPRSLMGLLAPSLSLQHHPGLPTCVPSPHIQSHAPCSQRSCHRFIREQSSEKGSPRG